MQGLNLIINIYHNNAAADDDVGGAVITGTLAYSGIAARISARRPSQQALEQGLIVNRLFDCVINGQGIIIRERDDIEIAKPLDSPYYGERMRVMGIQHDSRLPRRGHTELTLSRLERARSRQ